jgi:glutamate N-acetyltransferase/amino-acid N-acetyltransferase
VPFDQDAARQAMLGREVLFKVELGLGSGEAIAWGCDLSPEYVTFNSAYTT